MFVLDSPLFALEEALRSNDDRMVETLHKNDQWKQPAASPEDDQFAGYLSGREDADSLSAVTP